MKKGISLIVLVITIIVMIILAASVVITLSNTGVINRASQAVDLTNEAAVQDLAALTWADAYMDNKRGTDLVNEVTTKLGEQGVTADKWNISVTDTGVTVTSNKSSTTLGSLVKGPEDYGKIVDYTVTVDGTTYNEWQVCYEDEENNNIFIILKEGIPTRTLGSMETTQSMEDVYSIFKLGQPGFSLLSTYPDKGTGWLIGNFQTFADTNEKYKSYVVAAIGSPTFELIAAGYNAKYNTTAIIPVIDRSYETASSSGSDGYYINEPGSSGVGGLIIDEIYCVTGKYVWLAAKSAWGDRMGTVGTGNEGGVSSTVVDQLAVLRPVVCLNANIPAKVGTGAYDFTLTK